LTVFPDTGLVFFAAIKSSLVMTAMSPPRAQPREKASARRGGGCKTMILSSHQNPTLVFAMLMVLFRSCD
jgi:hypothetical protein